MSYRVYSKPFDGETALCLADSEAGVEAEILPGFGANLISLTYGGVELMRKPATMQELRDHPTRYGNPVLMPPNRIWNGTFVFEGRRHNFPINDATGQHHIHGLVKGARWDVTSHVATDDSATLTVSIASADTERNPCMWDALPIDYVLYLDFVLSAGELTVRARVENRDSKALPFGIGFHPYFRSPLAPTQPDSETPADSPELAECFIRCPGEYRWELAANFPTGRYLPVSASHDLRNWRFLYDLRLDDIYSGLPIEGHGKYLVGYEDRRAGLGIELAAGAEYPHWVVFTGLPGSGFVCLEPYTMVTNAFGLGMPPNQTGMLTVAPGASFAGGFSLRPYRIRR